MSIQGIPLSFCFIHPSNYLWRKIITMKRIIMLFSVVMLVSCASDQSSSQQTREQSATTASNPESTDNQTIVPAGTGGVSEQLTMYFPIVTAKPGETVCVDVQVKGFDKLLSMQYTVAWNKAILQFKELKNFKLPFLDEADFGQHITKDGLLTSAWLDDALKGVSVPDGTAIYQICFDVIGKSGEESFVKIADRPTPVEVANLREKIIPMKKEKGSVKVE